MNQIEKIVDEMDWALVKVKGDMMSTITGGAGENTALSPSSPEGGGLGWDGAYSHK